MPFYVVMLSLILLYGCSSRTITVEKDKKVVYEKVVDEKIIVEREPFTPIEFRKLMRELDDKLFIELDSKLFRGRDWVEYKDVNKTLKSFMAQTRELKKFEVIKNDEEVTRLLKQLITQEYLLDDIVKNEKFDYIKPAFDKVVESCNSCHNMII